MTQLYRHLWGDAGGTHRASSPISWTVYNEKDPLASSPVCWTASRGEGQCCRAKERAQKFTWAKTASETFGVLQSVIEDGI